MGTERHRSVQPLGGALVLTIWKEVGLVMDRGWISNPGQEPGFPPGPGTSSPVLSSTCSKDDASKSSFFHSNALLHLLFLLSLTGWLPP